MSKFSSGVIAFVTSFTGATDVTTPDNGLVTIFSLSSSIHFVFIDKESLPTGIDISRSMQILERASTPDRRA